jgi:hypothetical protein
MASLTRTRGSDFLGPLMVSHIGEVERQIAEVRRRRNLFAAQQVVYVPLALAGALVALLIGLAFLVPLAGYIFAVWAAIGLFAFGIVRALRRLRTSWLGADAARAIDNAAGLEERLTTLTALSSKRVESRLWGHLVADNLRLLGRWTPQGLTPRRVPRSIWPALAGAFVLAALLILASMSGDGDGEFLPRPGAHPDGSEEGEGALSFEATDDDAQGGAVVDWSELLAAMPERLREEILRRAKRAAPGTQPPPGAKPIGRKKGGGTAGADSGSEKGSGHEQGERIARDGAGPGGEGKAPGQELARREQPPGPRGAPRGSEAPAKGDGLKVLGQRSKGQETGGSAAGGSGAGAGTAPGSLYGTPEGEQRPSGLFALDLDAERGDGGEDGEGEPGSRPASPLASEQRIDDAVRRAQVPADYEKIVQRLFQRGDDPEMGR